jgi:hypothetical protein
LKENAGDEALRIEIKLTGGDQAERRFVQQAVSSRSTCGAPAKRCRNYAGPNSYYS